MSEIPSDRLDSMLRRLAQESPPSVPPGLRAGVWREIRRREAEVAEGWLTILGRLFERPQVALAALGVTALIGLAVGSLPQNRAADGRLAREALYFEVFSPAAPGSPAERIAYRP